MRLVFLVFFKNHFENGFGVTTYFIIVKPGKIRKKNGKKNNNDNNRADPVARGA